MQIQARRSPIAPFPVKPLHPRHPQASADRVADICRGWRHSCGGSVERAVFELEPPVGDAGVEGDGAADQGFANGVRTGLHLRANDPCNHFAARMPDALRSSGG